MSESTRNAGREPVPGHPGIYYKGDRLQVRWRHNGRELTQSFPKLTEAVRFKRQVDAGESQPTSRQPFDRYAREWLSTYQGRTSHGVAESTMASYRDAIERLAIPFFRTTPLDRIDPPSLRQFGQHLAGKGLARRTVSRYVAPVKALLATAHGDGLLKTNPGAGVRIIVPETRSQHPSWLTREQTRDLLAAMPAAHADLAFFLAATGCRISEALSVRWRDIARDESGQICVTITTSKTDAGRRTIVLSPETARRLMERRSGARFAGDEYPVFATSTGTRMDPRNWRRRVFNPAAEAAGVPWANPHKLRHGMASLMAADGRSAAEIAAYLGHADGGVLALRTYVHPDRLDSVAFIDEALT